jgi:hypothetical protein
MADLMPTAPDAQPPTPTYGQCTHCGALEVALNSVTHYRDLSAIGESSRYPSGYGCELCD